MKTNIGIVTTDEERERIARSLGHNGLVSRKDLTQAVETFVQDLIERNGYIVEKDLEISGPDPKADSQADQALERALEVEPGSDRDRSIREFMPSRGDEPYLYRAKDPELAARLRALLDDAERFEEYVWSKLEENRL